MDQTTLMLWFRMWITACCAAERYFLVKTDSGQGIKICNREFYILIPYWCCNKCIQWVKLYSNTAWLHDPKYIFKVQFIYFMCKTFLMRRCMTECNFKGKKKAKEVRQALWLLHCVLTRRDATRFQQQLSVTMCHIFDTSEDEKHNIHADSFKNKFLSLMLIYSVKHQKYVYFLLHIQYT